jgi:hypothetical protein
MKIFRKEPVTVQKQWHNYLWIFLSQFVATHHDPAVLLEAYRANVKKRVKEESEKPSGHNQHHQGHHDNQHHEKSSSSKHQPIHLTCGGGRANQGDAGTSSSR